MGILDKMKSGLDEAHASVNKLTKQAQKAAEESGMADRLQESLKQAQSVLETVGHGARDGLQRLNERITNQSACHGCEEELGSNEATWHVPLDLRKVGERLCWECVETRGLERICLRCQEVSLPMTREFPHRTSCPDCAIAEVKEGRARLAEAEARLVEARAQSEAASQKSKEVWRDYTRNVTNCTDDELRKEIEKLVTATPNPRGRHYGGRHVDFFVLCDELAGHFGLKGIPVGAVRILHDGDFHAVVGDTTVVLFDGAPDDFHAKFFSLDTEMYAMVGFALTPVGGLAGMAWTRRKMTALIEWVDEQINETIPRSPGS